MVFRFGFWGEGELWVSGRVAGICLEDEEVRENGDRWSGLVSGLGEVGTWRM